MKGLHVCRWDEFDLLTHSLSDIRVLHHIEVPLVPILFGVVLQGNIQGYTEQREATAVRSKLSDVESMAFAGAGASNRLS